MANADAFNSGFSMGLKKSGKKGDGDGSDSGGGPTKLGKDIKSYKKGGRVRKTGLALLHKGEVVVPAKHAKKSRKRASSKR